VCRALGLQTVRSVSEYTSPKAYVIKAWQESRFEVSKMSFKFILNTAAESQPECSLRASSHEQEPHASGTNMSTDMRSIETASPTHHSNPLIRILDSELKSPACESVQSSATAPLTAEETADVVPALEHQQRTHRKSCLELAYTLSNAYLKQATKQLLLHQRAARFMIMEWLVEVMSSILEMAQDAKSIIDTVEPCYQSGGIDFTDFNLEQSMETDLACSFDDEGNITDLVDYFHLEGEHIDHTIFNFSEPNRAASPLQS
jgi:hypothetical protein